MAHPIAVSCTCCHPQGILRAMDGLPVTLRLLDPPLHEFLPDGEMTEVGPTQ